jgi:nicotinamidase-related amidase
MPITALDPRTALVVIDLQVGIRATGASGIDAVVARSAELAAAFRDRGLPVVLVNVDAGVSSRTDRTPVTPPPRVFPPDFAELLAELGRHDDDILVTKKTWGAFHGTDLDARLRSAGVTGIVITGVATTAGVESTARAAHEHGYNVTFATDAMVDSDPIAHQNSVERIFPKIGETATTDEILAVLAAS